MFEANPYFNEKLTDLESKLKSKNYSVKLYKETAAWIKNGNLTFYLDKVNVDEDFWGSSIFENHTDVVESNKKSIQVPCVDIGSLLANYDSNDFIVMKIDIEGAEFELLGNLIARNLLDLIDVISTEFHPIDGVMKTATEMLTYIINTKNINQVTWI
jgi:FkbM family methyltransferase